MANRCRRTRIPRNRESPDFGAPAADFPSTSATLSIRRRMLNELIPGGLIPRDGAKRAARNPQHAIPKERCVFEPWDHTG